jgi:RNA polymerase-binding transcription factor DksA
MRPSLERDEARTLLQEEQARLQQIRVALEHGDGPSSPDAVIELQDVDERAPDTGLDLVDGDDAILEHVDARIADVDRALERLEMGEFGTCEACGRAIDADRLRARPAARFCIEHARAAETPA